MDPNTALLMELKAMSAAQQATLAAIDAKLDTHIARDELEHRRVDAHVERLYARTERHEQSWNKMKGAMKLSAILASVMTGIVGIYAKIKGWM